MTVRRLYILCLYAATCVPVAMSLCVMKNKVINLELRSSPTILLAELDPNQHLDIDSSIDLLRENIVSSLDFIRDAYIPGSLEGFVAEALANGIAGVLGSVISRSVSNAFGNKKKDTLATKAATTGAFFGTRRLIRPLLRTLGLPLPLIVVLSSLIASTFSSITKASLRGASYPRSDSTKDESQDSSTVASHADEKLNYPEVLGDIHKWLVYDLLYTDTDFSPQSTSLLSLPFKGEAAVPSLALDQSDTMVLNSSDYSTTFEDDMSNAFLFLLTIFSSIPVNKTFLCFIYGAIASVVGLAVIDVINYVVGITARSDSNSPHVFSSGNETSINPGIKYAMVAVEGSLLFGSFQCILNVLTEYIPEQYNVKFIFNSVLQGVLEGQ